MTFKARDMEFGFSALAGVLTICFALFHSVSMLALVHGTMGYTVWLTRILIDSRVIQACKSENVGRTKVYVEVAFSLSAMTMCFSPTLLKFENTASYFLFWGLFMVVSSLLLWLYSYITEYRVRADG